MCWILLPHPCLIRAALAMFPLLGKHVFPSLRVACREFQQLAYCEQPTWGIDYPNCPDWGIQQFWKQTTDEFFSANEGLKASRWTHLSPWYVSLRWWHHFLGMFKADVTEWRSVCDLPKPVAQSMCLAIKFWKRKDPTVKDSEVRQAELNCPCPHEPLRWSGALTWICWGLGEEEVWCILYTVYLGPANHTAYLR